jgi:hypothetical protein
MQSDPHPTSPGGCERRVHITSGSQRIGRPFVGDEEGVALCVDLNPAVTIEHASQDRPMLGERITIAIAKLAQQLGRRHDVRKHQGHRAVRQIRSHRLRLPITAAWVHAPFTDESAPA